MEQQNKKSFTTAIILSGLLGTFAVDRFYLGHIGIGLLKLAVNIIGIVTFTWWIWTAIDFVLIATRKVNNVQWRD